MLRSAAKSAVRRLALSNPWILGAAAIAGFVALLMVAALGAALGGALLQTQGADACEPQTGAPVNVSAPAANVRTMGEMVRYLESQSIPAVAAAGIVGNLMQESALNPTSPGYGLAEWNSGWWAMASSWISAHGRNPNTAGGQLMYIAANVTQNVDGGQFYPGLSSDLANASSPQEAALRWMNDYEQCSGAGPRGSLSFTEGSLCMAEKRESYAVQAFHAAGGAHGGAGNPQFVSLTSGGACGATFALTGSIKGYTNPFEKARGIVWERSDQGVDAAMQPGSPLLAFAPSKMVLLVPDFSRGQPAIVLEITAGPLAGKWWYWSEQIVPTVSTGQTVAAGQVVATYAPSGTGIEIGWWERNGGYPLGHPGYDDRHATHAGADFRYLLQALGANPGTGAGLSLGQTMGNAYYPTGNPGWQ